MNGILLINKEKNMTSRDVVNIVCKSLNTKKVGHTGTLDPLAEGVLVLAVGKYLKLVDDLTALDKEYIAEIKLGIKTDTLDITGNILEENNKKITDSEIDKVLKEFIGTYHMEVPKYSAIKVNGKKLYEYARNNEEVKLPVKDVEIYSIERINDIKDNTFKIKCHVSKGTYIRSLIRDITEKLGTIGTMTSLTRISQGKFKIEDCYTLDDINNNNYQFLDYNVLDMDKIEVNDELYNKIKNGVKLDNIYDKDKVCFIYNNDILAIYIKDNDKLRAKRVFNA